MMDYFFQPLFNHFLELLFYELGDAHLLLQFGHLCYVVLAFRFLFALFQGDLQMRLLLFVFGLLFRQLFWVQFLQLFLLKPFFFIRDRPYLFIFGVGFVFTFHSIQIIFIVGMNQSEMEEVYKMVDSIPFSRPKKSINRDFSDAVMLAELIYHYNPKMVSLHNYPPANSTTKKIENWNTLNTKVLKKLDLQLSKQQIEQISNCVPGVIQQFLYQVFLRFQKPEDQGKLVNNARLMDSKRSRMVNEEQNEQPQNKENFPNGRKQAVNVSSQAEEIIKLVEQIDLATQRLNKARQQTKLKDEIISNLQKKLEKVIFG